MNNPTYPKNANKYYCACDCTCDKEVDYAEELCLDCDDYSREGQETSMKIIVYVALGLAIVLAVALLSKFVSFLL